ncbi:hypothetical protein CMO88_03455 [Candidatus Woesearchaeota archaeon]|nr:hypothetical protein [Candidatus Woesearchaeota archaeon]
MVVIAFQDDVEKGFSRVKEDIFNLKRSVNRELVAIEELSGKLQTVLAKDEFYNFIKRLGERLDKLETNIDTYSGYDDELKEVDVKIKNLGKKISRQDDLSSEIKEVRKLRGKLSALEGSTVSAKKFNEELNKLLSDFSSLKEVMLTNKALEATKLKITKVNKRIADFEKIAPSKEEVSNNTETLTAQRQSFESHKSENQKKFDLLEKTLGKEVGDLKESSVNKESFDRRSEELKKELNSIRSLLDSSVSEIDLSDYVTKKEVNKKLLKLEETSSTGKLSTDVLNIEERLNSLAKRAASLNDIDKIGSDVKKVSKSIDALKVGIEKVAEVVQNRLDVGLDHTNTKFEKELAKVKLDLKKVDKGKGSAGQGVFSKIGKGVSDFFKEEDVPKKEVKKTKFSVSEFLKEEEKKKGFGIGKFLLIGSLVLVIVFAGLFFYFSTQFGGIFEGEEALQEIEVPEELPEEEKISEKSEIVETEGSIIDTEKSCEETYECKERVSGEYWFNCYLDEEESCRCFVTDATGCGLAEEVEETDSRNNTFYIIAALIVSIITLLVFYFISRGEEKEGDEEKENKGDGVDLEEFFQKKNNNKK